MTSATIYPAICGGLEQTPEDVGQNCDSGLDNHNNHKNNARDEEKYHLREYYKNTLVLIVSFYTKKNYLILIELEQYN